MWLWEFWARLHNSSAPVEQWLASTLPHLHCCCCLSLFCLGHSPLTTPVQTPLFLSSHFGKFMSSDAFFFIKHRSVTTLLSANYVVSFSVMAFLCSIRSLHTLSRLCHFIFVLVFEWYFALNSATQTSTYHRESKVRTHSNIQVGGGGEGGGRAGESIRSFMRNRDGSAKKY